MPIWESNWLRFNVRLKPINKVKVFLGEVSF